jgi:hypothetical protein
MSEGMIEAAELYNGAMREEITLFARPRNQKPILEKCADLLDQ